MCMLTALDWDDVEALDHSIEWARDARDGLAASGHTGPAKLIAAALVLLTRAKVELAESQPARRHCRERITAG